jgi:hypothetical protein
MRQRVRAKLFVGPSPKIASYAGRSSLRTWLRAVVGRLIMSATPTLTSAPIVLQLVNGPRLRLAPGEKLTVEAFAGARRRHLEAVTTAQGIQNRISFEVPPGTRFFLRADLAPPPDGHYRADAVLDARPIGSAYVVSRDRFAIPGMMTYALSFAVGFFFVGGLVGLFITMGWRTGCASGKHPVPTAALVDAGSIAAVLSMLGIHVGVAQIAPDAMLAMQRQQR